MPALDEWQYAIDDFVFGYNTSWPVNEFDVSYPDMRTQDQPSPREDGVNMGIDRHGAMTAQFEMECVGDGENDTLDLMEQMRNAWYGDDRRLNPQDYQVLSYRTGGTGEQRRMYGRARAWTPASLRDLHVGHVPIAAQFVARDGYFYSDTEFVEQIPLIPAETGGLVGPLIGPIFASGFGGGSSGFVVAGTKPAWLVSRINGPIIRPTLTVIDQWAFTLDVSLGVGESMIVDPQPWRRSVRHSNGGNGAGDLTGNSAWLADMRVPPGPQDVLLRGQDPTGTASAEMYWRTVRASL